VVSISTVLLDPASVLVAVSTPQSGGVDMFVGTVRDHSGGRRVKGIEYTAYVPMAEKLMAEIERDVRRQWSIENIILMHRIGVLSVGEVAVVTAVAAAHRKEAFEACRYAIDRIKSIVPIWKRELYEDQLASILPRGGHHSS
jgi:molybdopterin synthase catalytic subunit